MGSAQTRQRDCIPLESHYEYENCPADGTRTHTKFPQTQPARTSIKVLIELFQKFAGRGQRPRRSPQRAKLPQRSRAWRAWGLQFAFGKLSRFACKTCAIKKSPFLNNIREADTSLRTCKRTCTNQTYIPTYKRDMHQPDMHPDILTDMHLHIHINTHKSGMLINMQKSE